MGSAHYAPRLMDANTWLESYAEKLGVPAPTNDELNAVLDLAAVAAHSSQRIAAPVAAWMAGKAGVDLDEATRLAEAVPSDPADD